MTWAVAVTTCPERLQALLPQTLASLERAGFTVDRVMLDGPADGAIPPRTTVYDPPIGPYANWVMALSSLFWTHRHAERFAVFEDDILAVGHLREYLDRSPFPERGYWNLALHLSNAQRAKFHDGPWFPATERGIGALGLVFDNAGVRALLGSAGLIDAAIAPGSRYPFYVDGTISVAMDSLGYVQYCHKPSLLGHVGFHSTWRNRKWDDVTKSWPGEEQDARDWLLVPT